MVVAKVPANEYNGDRKILTAIRAAAFVINVFQERVWDTILPSRIIAKVESAGIVGVEDMGY